MILNGVVLGSHPRKNAYHGVPGFHQKSQSTLRKLVEILGPHEVLSELNLKIIVAEPQETAFVNRVVPVRAGMPQPSALLKDMAPTDGAQKPSQLRR